jgi:hypothetical protein
LNLDNPTPPSIVSTLFPSFIVLYSGIVFLSIVVDDKPFSKSFAIITDLTSLSFSPKIEFYSLISSFY